MTNEQINFIVSKYFDRHHLSMVETRNLVNVLRKSDPDTQDVIMMLMFKKPLVKESYQ